jgi:hypothetical protein
MKPPKIRQFRIEDPVLHAEFEDGSLRDFNLRTLDFYDLLKREGRIAQATLDPGGYGISWDDEHDVSENRVWNALTPASTSTSSVQRSPQVERGEGA